MHWCSQMFLCATESPRSSFCVDNQLLFPLFQHLVPALFCTMYLRMLMGEAGDRRSFSMLLILDHVEIVEIVLAVD